MKTLTNQQIFDKVSTHLLKQGTKSISENVRSLTGNYVCAYRGFGGLMCAAGCLIPDDEYTGEMEGKNWTCVRDKFPEKCKHISVESDFLVRDLQCIHDTESPDNWIPVLIDLAKEIKLNYDLLK